MKQLQQLLLYFLLILGSNLVITAQNPTEYDPGNPPEPENLFSLTLQMNSSSAGYVSGEGNYPAGKSVRVYAYVYSGYQFISWTEGDSVISTARDFYYVMPARKVVLKANYTYVPAGPDEPENKYTLKILADPSGAGYFTNDNQRNVPGTKYNVYAYPYSGYQFTGWFHNDTLVSVSTPYNYTTRNYNDTLYARFRYVPGNPGEPNTGTGTLINLSLLTPSVEKGKTVAFPVHLYNRNMDIFSTNFELHFPGEALVDMQSATLSGRKNGHTLSIEQLSDSSYSLTISGADTLMLSGSSGVLLTVPVTVPQQWETDKIYPVLLRNATVRTATGTLSSPVKPGGIRVLSEEGGLFASFYPDIYLNRAQFVNLSSPLAESFSWDFGDGNSSIEKSPLHSYRTGGNYTVKLKVAKGELTDSAQFNIVIAEQQHWRISGNFTLNANRLDVRNFNTAEELFTLFSQSQLSAVSSIQVESGQNHPLTITAVMKSQLIQLLQKLQNSGVKMTFFSIDSLMQPTLNFIDTIDQEALDMLIELWQYMPANQVKYAIQNVVLNSEAIRNIRSQQLCSGGFTKTIDFSDINNSLSYTWRLLPGTVNTTGYQEEGQQQIPVMNLINTSENADTLNYEVSTTIPGTTFTRLLSLKIITLPLLVGAPVLQSPSQSTDLASPTITFAWSKVTNAIYDLYIWEASASAPVTPGFSGITTNSFSNSTFCKYGKSYLWKIAARGTCNTLFSKEGSFSIRTLPDLQVTKISYPQELYAGDVLTVDITVTNKGGNTPSNSYWRDEIALSRNENLEGILILTSASSYRNILSDSSYTVSMKFTLPLDTIPYSRFVVRTDINNQLMERDETNNVSVSNPITIIQPRIEPEDYNRLRTFYQQTGGPEWKKRWSINSDVIIAQNWPGVHFTRGKVSAINLNSNNLKGKLPAIVFNFSELKKLELQDNQLSGSLTQLADSILQFPQFSDSLTYLNLGKNKLKGELSSFASRFQALNTLLVFENQIDSLDEPLPSRITQLNIQYQKVKIDSMDMAVHPEFGQLPRICLYNHSASAFNHRPGFTILHTNNTVGYISYYNNQYYLSWNNSAGWRIPSGAPLELMQHNGSAYGSRSPFKLFFLHGDANIDRIIDLLDVQHSLNYVLRNNPELFNYYAANTFGDDQLNVQDLVTTVEMILENDSLNTPEATGSRKASEYTAENSIYIQDTQLLLQISQPVSALDIRIAGLTTSAYEPLIDPSAFTYKSINTSNGGMRFILFSPSGERLLPGTHLLGKLNSSSAQIERVQLSDEYATEVPVAILNTVTSSNELSNSLLSIKLSFDKVIIETSSTEENAELKIYNLQGILVETQQLNHIEAGRTIQLLKRPLSNGVYLLEINFLRNKSKESGRYRMVITN